MSKFILLSNTMLTVDGTLHFENMDIGVMTTILGFVMVFMVLIIICLLLAIFSVIVKDKKQQQVQNNEPVRNIAAPVSIPVKTAPAASVQNYVDDKELVAVITAAIAATMGTGTDGLVVRRIRRVGNWNQEAIEQQQNSFF